MLRLTSGTAQLAGTGVALSIAYPGMTTTAMTAEWGPEGRTAAAMLRAWDSSKFVSVTQVRALHLQESVLCLNSWLRCQIGF